LPRYDIYSSSFDKRFTSGGQDISIKYLASVIIINIRAITGLHGLWLNQNIATGDSFTEGGL